MTLTLNQAVEVFQRCAIVSAPELSSPEASRGLCGQSAITFLNFLAKIDIDAVNLAMAHKDLGFHVVTVVDGDAYDWTARQFQTDAPFPKVCPLSEFLSLGWEIVEHQFPTEAPE